MMHVGHSSCSFSMMFNPSVYQIIRSKSLRVLALESWDKGTDMSSLGSLVMDEERMRLGCWLVSVL